MSCGTLAGHEHVFTPGTSGWTLLLLHGTGGSEHDLLPLGRRIAPGAGLLGVRGTVLEAGVVTRFFARRGMDDIDVEDMHDRADALREFLAAAVDAYGLDETRVVAVGYSNGANVALDMLLRHPASLRAAGLLRPVLYDAPGERPDLAHVDVLLAAGARDPYTAPARIGAARDVLADSGARVRLETAPAGHELVQADVDALATWTSDLLAPTLP